MRKLRLALPMTALAVASILTACSSTGSNTKTTEASVAETTAEDAEKTEETTVEETESEDNTAEAETESAEPSEPAPEATAEQVQSFMNDDDENTLLVDARPQEAYSGWALEGAANGGHLKNALLFSARWLDCEYAEAAPREAYLERSMNDQGITAGKEVIVYDYTGEQAQDVASYFKKQGVEDVYVYQANELIDAGTDLVSYENHDRFLPTEIVKSISDVKTGKADKLSDEAYEIVGDNIDNVVLVDVSWGNARESTYFSVGHVPGSVHINTDSYERPRVYIPEKRSAYATEWRLISLDEFRDSVCTQYGITKDSIVIVSGTDSSPQARISFMLRSLGVQVYVMSGNLTAWTYNGYELDTDESTLVVPASVEDFGSDEIANPDEILWMDDIKAILNGEMDGQVADNRGEDEWKGEYSGYSYHDLAGHIEGSIWCLQGDDENGEYFLNADHTPRTQAELINYMEGCGLDTSKGVIAFFCGDSWGAAQIAYWCQSVDINNIKEWGNGWIPWSNEGNEFIDHNGNKVHYDKYRDTLLDENGNDMRDGVNILDDSTGEE